MTAVLTDLAAARHATTVIATIDAALAQHPEAFADSSFTGAEDTAPPTTTKSDELSDAELWLQRQQAGRTVADFDAQVARERAASRIISRLEAEGKATDEAVRAALDYVEDLDEYDAFADEVLTDEEYARRKREYDEAKAEEAADSAAYHQRRSARSRAESARERADWAAEREWLDTQLEAIGRLRAAYKTAWDDRSRGAVLYRYNRVRATLERIYGAELLPAPSSPRSGGTPRKKA